MEIKNKVVNYEIQKQLSQNTPSLERLSGGRPNQEEQQVKEAPAAQDDTIVELSSASKEAQKIREAIAASPNVREEKVAALKKQIETGEYTVDHEAVAEKIIDAFTGKAI